VATGPAAPDGGGARAGGEPRDASISPWRRALRAAFVLGGGIRLANAFTYPTYFGFDVGYNWEYVQRLCASWAPPPPDAGWSFAHPPLFYALGALVGRAIGCADPTPVVLVVRLLSSAAGLVAIAATVMLVRRVDPGNERRAFLAGALLLFLPAHIQMSASFGEEVLAAAFATAAVALASRLLVSPRDDLRRAAGLGLFAGLAWLTKLTGVLAGAAAVLALALEGWRRGRLREAALRCAVVALLAGTVGGWFYARNLAVYGYLYPQDLAVHAEMHRQRPGERTLFDYVYVPVATFSRPLVRPDLLRSVWGGTYATLWFDGHRHFLPARGEDVRRTGTALLLLALLPTAAFLAGAGAGLLRALARTGEPDPVLLLQLGLTLAGYVLFTWSNPWWSTVKGTYLLGAMLPFAFYASEPLARWTAGRNLRSAAVAAALAALAALVTIAFSYGLVWSGGGP
jgi:hypothetical protein